ncbi:outer membrane protein [Microbulbifer donghaiensis]|uniref:Outer membrane protein n=1 Tax=Microbulbifer donghaiensis TaxID=494016 RepID=A0A1M5H8N1_9GAMM|nr:OmpW family outer membrane protein [Microbulbifer donghaiensis]SHG12276.1 outer membrane protein [Microbulbifer donghaiensis]
MKMTRVLVPVMAPLALAVSGVASAGPSGYAPPPPPPKKQEFIVRVGGSYVSPRADSVTFTDERFDFLDIRSFRGTVDPDDEWGWFINFEWKAMDHFGLELNYTDGGSHRGGSARRYFNFVLPDVTVGSIGEFEPEITTLMMKWYPLDPSCLVQPYAGFGINYTDFGGEKFRGWRRRELRDLGLRSRFSMGYSWGYAAQIGVDFSFGHDSAWLVNAAAIYTRAESDIRFSVFDVDPVAIPQEDRFFEAYSADYEYDPWIFNLGVGYKFSF